MTVKRYLVLTMGTGSEGNLFVFTESDTLVEAVREREEALDAGSAPVIIAEVIPSIDAYALAHREAAAQAIAKAYGRTR